MAQKGAKLQWNLAGWQFPAGFCGLSATLAYDYLGLVLGLTTVSLGSISGYYYHLLKIQYVSVFTDELQSIWLGPRVYFHVWFCELFRDSLRTIYSLFTLDFVCPNFLLLKNQFTVCLKIGSKFGQSSLNMFCAPAGFFKLWYRIKSRKCRRKKLEVNREKRAAKQSNRKVVTQSIAETIRKLKIWKWNPKIEKKTL